MTTTPVRTLGAALVVTALALPGLPAGAQAPKGAATRPPARTSPSLPPLPVTEIDTRAPAAADTEANPQRAPRPPTPPLPPVPATQVDDRLPASHAGHTFSLSFAAPQPIRDVLLLMLKDSGVSVAIDPDVTGTFTGELANVTLQQALGITLPPLGLAYTLENGVLRVFRRPTDTRFFSVNYVATRRTSEPTPPPRGAEQRPGAPAAGASAVSGAVAPPEAADFYDELGNTVTSLLSEAGKFTIDRRAGLVQVTDYPDRLDRVARYLELAELRATRQVQIEATFLEVDLNDAASAGINWTAVVGAATSAAQATSGRAAAGGGTFALGVQAADLDGVLKALATQGSVRVVARPRVAAMNNQPAIISGATERPSIGPEPRDTSDRDGRTPPRSSQPTVAEAIALTVTPQISADGFIQMRVAPALARPAGERAVRHGAVTVSSADTLLRVHEGETVVLGGFMRAPAGESRPSPRRGKATDDAGSTRLPAPRTELVILLTPRVI